MGIQESANLQDWFVAYRKMKVDYYYSSMTGNYSALLDYEMNLEKNLRDLSSHVDQFQSCQDESDSCLLSEKLDFRLNHKFCGILSATGFLT